MNTPTRPALRYYGGKWLTGPWIIGHFPKHKIYVEPYGGAGSVLMQKPRSYAEIYNDIDGEVVNFFKQLRDHGPELKRRVELTPFSRQEHTLAYKKARSPIEQARQTVIKTFLGFGSDSIWRKSGFRANCNRSGTTPAIDWRHFPSALTDLSERFQGVVIEDRPALRVIEDQDGPETLFYVDPPYIHSSRVGGERYRHEMSEAEHIKLSLVLKAAKGKVVLSAYPDPLYDRLYKKWHREEKKVLSQYMTDSKKAARVEVLWMNFRPEQGLFR